MDVMAEPEQKRRFVIKRSRSLYKYPAASTVVEAAISTAQDADGRESQAAGAFWSAAARTFEEATESLKKTEALLAEMERAVKETSL
jgi:hypothetical protein